MIENLFKVYYTRTIVSTFLSHKGLYVKVVDVWCWGSDSNRRLIAYKAIHLATSVPQQMSTSSNYERDDTGNFKPDQRLFIM